MQKKIRGYYLLEVLIAFLIIGVGILALLHLHSVVSTNITLNKQRIEAATLAQDKIEEFRNYQKLLTTSGYTAYQDITSSTSAQTVTGTSATYNQSWTVTTNTNPDYKIVTVTVSWTSQLNTAESVRLSTIIGENDPAASGRLLNVPSSGN